MKTRLFLAPVVAMLLFASCAKDEYLGSPDKKKKTDPTEQDGPSNVISAVLFSNGDAINGTTYVTFRIPSLVRTATKVFAFCEARMANSDSGDIDIAYRVSTDDGQTWGERKILFSDAAHTVGNPCCVYTSTGRMVLVFNWQVDATATGKSFPSELGVTYTQYVAHPRRVFVAWSDDEGNTWSKPKDITEDVMERKWTWNAAGPCHAIQIQNGQYKGRIIVPCDNKYSGSLPDGRDSYVIYSDDNGETWKKSETVKYGNECCAVELSNGKVMLDMRNVKTKYYSGKNCRAWALSADGGQTWGAATLDPNRPEPSTSETATQGCQASIINYNPEGKITSNLIFSNPASESSRIAMTLRFSKDDGATWPKSVKLSDHPAGYSDMVVLKDGSLGHLYESGGTNYHQGLFFYRYPKSQIEEYFK